NCWTSVSWRTILKEPVEICFIFNYRLKNFTEDWPLWICKLGTPFLSSLHRKASKYTPAGSVAGQASILKAQKGPVLHENRA
uniref:Uncharacterized protein n=1 Tax=Pavo cristatus TaxID=9049 RepID=A0A8C9LC82_PAVCR